MGTDGLEDAPLGLLHEKPPPCGLLGRLDKPFAHDRVLAVDQRSLDGGRGDAFVDRSVLRPHRFSDHLDESGKLAPDPPIGTYPDLARVHETEVVEEQDGVAGEMGPGANRQNGLHELVVTGGGNLIKAVHTPGNVAQPASLSQLAKLDDGHAEAFSVTCCDVAVLVLGALEKAPAIGLCECQW